MSNIIIGRPGNPDRYVYNPKDARDVLSGRVEPFRAPANLPNIPDNLITDEMRLQNIIDNKNLSKNIPSPDREGMNVYQDIIQDFRTSTPERGEVYTKRFPITNAMMTLPSAIFENTGVGRILSAIGDGARGAANFAGGLFPGVDLSGAAEDFMAAGPGIIKDTKTLLGLKDDNPVKGEVRNALGVKKNTSEDMVESSDVFDIATEDRNEGIPQGTPVSDFLIDQTTRDEFLKRNNQFTGDMTIADIARQSSNAFDPKNPGQIVNFIRDNSGYFDQVIKQLGLGGR